MKITILKDPSVESWNRLIRAWISGVNCHSRQTNLADNLRDTLSHGLIVTHPTVAASKVIFALGLL